jgi:hypothetical protein
MELNMDCGDAQKIKDGLATLGLTLAESAENRSNGNTEILVEGVQVQVGETSNLTLLQEKPTILAFDTGDTNRFW